MQIPAGVLLDRYGPRRVLSIAALLTAGGTAIFALSESIYGASVGRGLIGAAVGVSFVGVIALSVRWFEPNRVSFATGVALFVGILGGIFGGAPLRWLADNFGWRPVMSASAGVALVIGAAIVCLMRDNPSEKGFRDLHEHAGSAPSRGTWGSALRRPVLWAIFVAQGGITNTTLTFAGLWGVPFLVSHYGMTTAQAAVIASASLLAMAVGGPALALASERAGSNRAVCIIACSIGFIAWATIVLTPALPRPVLVALLLITGFCSGALVLGIALAREFVNPQLAGTATGIANMGAVLGPTLMQPFAGVVLDLKWDGATSQGVRIYSFAAYQAAFALMAAWVAIGLVIFALLPRRK
jgi:MFS family permease